MALSRYVKKFGNHITEIFWIKKKLSNRQTFMDRPDKYIFKSENCNILYGDIGIDKWKIYSNDFQMFYLVLSHLNLIHLYDFKIISALSEKKQLKCSASPNFNTLFHSVVAVRIMSSQLDWLSTSSFSRNLCAYTKSLSGSLVVVHQFSLFSRFFQSVFPVFAHSLPKNRRFHRDLIVFLD